MDRSAAPQATHPNRFAAARHLGSVNAVKLLRSTRARIAAVLTVAILVLAAGVTAARQQPPVVPDPPAVPAASIPAGGGEPVAQAAAAQRASGSKTRSPAAARVPDVPLAWRRIAASAAAWPPPTDPLPTAEGAALPTVPASRVRDTIGLNIDVWRTEYGYRDFAPVIAKVAELQLRHARAPLSSIPGPGLSRMQSLGRIGVRWNVLLGDAYGRFGLAPLSTLKRRLDDTLLPYVDSVEGTNEPDLAKRADWPPVARQHQERVVRAVRRHRTDPLAVITPSVGRLESVAQLGDLSGLADASNAHAYSSGDEPSKALDDWLALLPQQLSGAPVTVTEAGFMTDQRQRKHHTPTSEEAAAVYAPRLILEAMRRGIPRVYIYELMDRWDDPFGIDIAAHFGLLGHDLKPKPAWHSLVRLQKTLLDGGRPDRKIEALNATVVDAPTDLRVLAFRKRDGSAAVALWRSAEVWDGAAGTPINVPPSPVRLRLAGDQPRALARDLVTGKRTRPAAGDLLALDVSANPVVITGLRD